MKWPRCSICHTRTACHHNRSGKQALRALSQRPEARRFRAYYARNKERYNEQRRQRRAFVSLEKIAERDVQNQFVKAMVAGFKQGFAAEITLR